MTQTGRAIIGSGNLFGRRLKQTGKNPQSRAQSLRPMSDNAILAAMRRMGVAKEEMSGHGFRAVARTILDEVHRTPTSPCGARSERARLQPDGTSSRASEDDAAMG